MVLQIGKDRCLTGLAKHVICCQARRHFGQRERLVAVDVGEWKRVGWRSGEPIQTQLGRLIGRLGKPPDHTGAAPSSSISSPMKCKGIGGPSCSSPFVVRVVPFNEVPRHLCDAHQSTGGHCA